MSFKVLEITPVKLDDDKSELILLDQTLLPGETKYLHLTTLESIWEAIYKLRVRGAPAIGITGAYGVYLAVKHSQADNFNDFYAEFKKAKDEIQFFGSIPCRIFLLHREIFCKIHSPSPFYCALVLILTVTA
jgi:methylthioribose-1-phosphate isomerase